MIPKKLPLTLADVKNMLDDMRSDLYQAKIGIEDSIKKIDEIRKDLDEMQLRKGSDTD